MTGTNARKTDQRSMATATHRPPWSGLAFVHLPRARWRWGTSLGLYGLIANLQDSFWRRLEMMHPFSERRNEIPKDVFYIVWSMSHYLWLIYKKQPQPTSNGFSFWNILGSFPLLSHRGAFCLVFQSRQYVGHPMAKHPASSGHMAVHLQHRLHPTCSHQSYSE